MEERILEILANNKIKNVQVLNTNFKGSIVNNIIVGTFASEKNTRQTALKIKENLEMEFGEISIDGEFPGDWIILGVEDTFVELMTEDKRAYYNLEKFWGDNKASLNKLKTKLKK